MRNSEADRGAAAVEFALIAVLLIPMLILIIEGGRLWMVQASLASAARDGAREMAIKNEDSEAVARAAKVFEPFGTLTADNLDIGGCPTTPGPNDQATVTAEFDAQLLTGFFVSSVKLQGIGAMRCSG